jgi:hypothetical protein
MSRALNFNQAKFVKELFVSLGFESQAGEVIAAQSESWHWLFENNNLTDYMDLAVQYRNLFGLQKVSDPYKVVALFAKFIKDNPTVAALYFEDRLKYIECDYCEGHGVVMIPMIGRDNVERSKAFRCTCTKGKIQYAGLPEPTEEMLKWRLFENRRELQKAREYLQGLGLDPDRSTFADMWKKLQATGGPMFTIVS